MQKNQNERYAPIVMFVYNRADHFEQTYRALAACPEAAESELFIFSDGPKNEQGAGKVAEVRRALRQAEEEHLFKAIHITESPVNRGLADSVINGVSRVIGEYGRVIVVEDDCKASPFFLAYMNRALAFYQDHPQVGSIAGYIPAFPFPEDYHEDVFLTYRSCSWGWATWSDRWEGVDWDMTTLKDFGRHPKLIRKLNSCGSDRFLRLYRQTKGNSTSWSVRFGAHLVRRDLYTVYPRYSYISNIGCDASGVHSRAEDAESMRVDLSRAIPEPRMADLTYDRRIQRAMKKHYSAGFLSDVKRAAATTAIAAKLRFTK